MDPIRAALLRRRSRLCPIDQSINAPDAWAEQFLQPASDAARAATVAGWSALLPQSVPRIGEEVGYVEPCEPV